MWSCMGNKKIDKLYKMQKKSCKAKQIFQFA